MPEFEWDPDKAVRNVAEHGISFAGATTVFGDPLSITYFDPDHSAAEDRFITFGHTSDNLFVVVSHEDRSERGLSAFGWKRDRRENNMKKDKTKPKEDVLRPAYDLTKLRSGIRGKYVQRYRSGTNLALLAPDVRAAIPPDEAVNQALRSLIQT